MAEGNLHLEKRAGGVALICDVITMGEDCVVCIRSGENGHVGSAAMAVSRPSLTGEGTSATTSVLNRTGHKDGEITVRMAQSLASALESTVCVVCGIHADGLSADEIQLVVDVCGELEKDILTSLIGEKDMR